jgi:hypothetical protein
VTSHKSSISPHKLVKINKIYQILFLAPLRIIFLLPFEYKKQGSSSLLLDFSVKRTQKIRDATPKVNKR